MQGRLGVYSRPSPHSQESQPVLASSDVLLAHGMTLFRRAANHIHNLANQPSIISLGLTTLKRRSTNSRLAA
jgi:hypothetical protein